MAILRRHVMNKRIANGQLSGKPGTVYDVYLKLKTTEGYHYYEKRGFLRRADALEHVQSMFSMYSCPKPGSIYIIPAIGYIKIGELTKSDAQFIKNVDLTGLSKETYLRVLVTEYYPKVSPPPEYHELIRQLLAIGNTQNQIAAKLHSLAVFDAMAYADKHLALMNIILAIHHAIESPDGQREPHTYDAQVCLNFVQPKNI